MSKIIIGIHGLGNKPPKAILKEWWEKSILEGLKKYNYTDKKFEFELVYWADILHSTPLDPDETNKNNPFFLKHRYMPDQSLVPKESYGFRKKAREYFDKYYGKILVNEVLSLKYPSLTDFFIHINMPDLENYYLPNNNGTTQYAKQKIIERLTETLVKHKHKKILLMGHSMGTIISHDALIDYLPDIEIDTLVSIGSPLGQKYVLNKILEEQKVNLKNKLNVPENIKRNWYNLSDLEDQVALNHLLAEIFVHNSKGVKVTDTLVQNNYLNSGIRNPHNIYGYLRTPECAEIINAFITRRKFRLFGWFRNFGK
ncbi:MAG: hypothetical protein P4L27_14340 [Ignavibacteriaceae bacterium]|nr:hypothetical protein [Ignavibacteriaceae bacterium]